MEKNIKSAEEILDSYRTYADNGGLELEYAAIIQAMKTYAKMIVEAQLEIAAEEALIDLYFNSLGKVEQSFNHYDESTDTTISTSRKSIRNCTRVELT